jgi:hypothetical protein
MVSRAVCCAGVAPETSQRRVVEVLDGLTAAPPPPSRGSGAPGEAGLTIALPVNTVCMCCCERCQRYTVHDTKDAAWRCQNGTNAHVECACCQHRRLANIKQMSRNYVGVRVFHT